MMSATAIIALCGGTKNIARATGASPGAVSKWAQRNKIPSKYFGGIVACSSGELTRKDLVTLHATRPVSRQEVV